MNEHLLFVAFFFSVSTHTQYGAHVALNIRADENTQNQMYLRKCFLFHRRFISFTCWKQIHNIHVYVWCTVCVCSVKHPLYDSVILIYSIFTHISRPVIVRLLLFDVFAHLQKLVSVRQKHIPSLIATLLLLLCFVLLFSYHFRNGNSFSFFLSFIQTFWKIPINGWQIYHLTNVFPLHEYVPCTYMLHTLCFFSLIISKMQDVLQGVIENGKKMEEIFFFKLQHSVKQYVGRERVEHAICTVLSSVRIWFHSVYASCCCWCCRSICAMIEWRWK